MKRIQMLLLFSLMHAGCCSELFAGNGIKLKSGGVLTDVDSLQIFGPHITFYYGESPKWMNLSKFQLEYIRLSNDRVIRYKRYENSSTSSSLHTVNFRNGSFSTGTVQSIAGDTLYFILLNQREATALDLKTIGFINYGNSLVEEFDFPDMGKSSVSHVDSVFASKSYGGFSSQRYLGVKAGYVSSGVNTQMHSENLKKDGFMLGGVYYNRFGRSGAMDLTLAYIEKGGTFDIHEQYFGNQGRYQLNFNYLEFQSNYQVIFPFKKWNLFFDAGLFLAHMVSASGAKTSVDPDSSFDINLSEGPGDLNRFDIGLSLGTGASFKWNDRLLSVGFRLGDGWRSVGSSFDSEFDDLNRLRSQNYIAFYAVYGFYLRKQKLGN